eukprot:CAMPEP_0183703136 /NCGR_PEP_ID=MMETSP0737-20130205/993_1 /TAXON_ID=385413 /ORGANISM="Thalassiosira miniscula, Strain CCMP1093" /LENGTH=668 /DNA_ID=CAMNT_0025929845 /DNA_START=642 /DNA_END=2648 /DNA_ORIENTATION=-
MKVSLFFVTLSTGAAAIENESLTRNKIFGNASKLAIDKATCLYQADFDHGTKIISTAGTYKLCEDIEFGPNGPAEPGQLPEEDAFDPKYDAEYRENEFGLGFFSALCITSPDVTIYLNNYTIEQSPGHALMQRFFSVIELASSPFVPGVGPAQFVGDDETFVPARNIKILGPGKIGRSSHHGIHGNDNAFVKITNVEFFDFEVGAVSLNNVDHLEISDCDITGNRDDVPVVGLFSAARFLRPYGKYLKEEVPKFRMRLYDSASGKFKWKSAADVYDNLIAAINNVYDDVINGNGQIDEQEHEEEYHLFHNPFQLVDGPCYAFLVNGKGPAVGGQGWKFNEEDDTSTSSDVVIKNNHIQDIKCWNNEVPALFGECGNHGCVINDPLGAIFQTIKTFDSANPYLARGKDGRYNGNVVSDMQIMVAQAISENLIPDIPSRQISGNSINNEVIDWATKGSVLKPQYVCNGDSMHHVMKGIIVIRVEETAGFDIEGNTINNIENLSVEPFSNCDDYHIGASEENEDEAQAGNVRAISVAAVRGYSPGNRKSRIKGNKIGVGGGIYSDEANVIIGIDVQGDSQRTTIIDNTINLQENIFQGHDDQFIAIRIREAVDGSVTIKQNNLAQDTQILNTQMIRGRVPRKLKKLHTRVSGGTDWSVGGCPFASSYAIKR